MIRKLYSIELEIFEGGKCAAGHKVGDKFKWPEDRGKLCPWLLEAANSFIRILEYDGKLLWTYNGTPYEKIIDKNGITTEFVRCQDPTSAGVVLKITRKELPPVKIKKD